MWTLNGATVYMRAVNTEGAATELFPSNWITATVRSSAGGWSQGLSQAVYLVTTPGPQVFAGSYHVGSETGTYGPCSIGATIVNNTYGGDTSNLGYGQTFGTRLVATPGAAPAAMDWSASVAVVAGDGVRAVLSCNTYLAGPAFDAANSPLFRYIFFRNF